MTISVIIPTCNRNDLLSKCVNLLDPAVQKKTSSNYEVIITDDSKENTAKDLIKKNYPWARWIEGPKKGPAANRNYGAKQSTGNWLVFIDDDCLPVTDIVFQYEQAITIYPTAGAFEGSIWPDDEKLLVKDMAECPVNKVGGYFWTANVCIKKEYFERVNGFDEDFLLAAHEDQILHLRLKQVTSVLFIPEIKVIHPVRFISLSKKIKSNRKKFDNWLIYTEKKSQPFFSAIKEALSAQIRELAHHVLSFKPKNAILNCYTLGISLPALVIRQIIKPGKEKQKGTPSQTRQLPEKHSAHL